MDLNKLDLQPVSDEGADMHLEHPVTGERLFNDDGDAMVIRLIGRDSKRFRAKNAQIANRKMAKRNNRNSVEELDSDGAELLAACTLGWSGLALNGEPLPFSEQNALKLYTNPGYRWIREQVDTFIADRANFFMTA